MSVESATAFYRRAVEDEAFLATIANARTRNDRIAIVRREGFDFTPAELETATAAFLESLSEHKPSTERLSHTAISLLGIDEEGHPRAMYGIIGCFYSEPGRLAQPQPSRTRLRTFWRRLLRR